MGRYTTGCYIASLCRMLPSTDNSSNHFHFLLLPVVLPSLDPPLTQYKYTSNQILLPMSYHSPLSLPLLYHLLPTSCLALSCLASPCIAWSCLLSSPSSLSCHLPPPACFVLFCLSSLSCRPFPCSGLPSPLLDLFCLPILSSCHPLPPPRLALSCHHPPPAATNPKLTAASTHFTLHSAHLQIISHYVLNHNSVH